MCAVCDTLRTDDDTGDECVACGAVYNDPPRRVKVWDPAPPSPRVVKPVAKEQVPPHRRLGWFHNTQMHGVGLDKGSRGR